jgi:diguanylate cyclase (GGDEF)-like protein/PAS domain S-box-containing protein
MARAKETDKTREQLVKTVASLRQQITALERTVELLQKERDTFFSILERAPYGVVLLDKNGKVLFTNAVFTTITGYTLEDVPTTSDWARLAYPDKQYRDKISASEAWKRNKAQRETNGLFHKMLNRFFFRSFSVVCKDETVKEIEFKPSALDDGSTIVMLADITERKRAEEAFRESEKQFRLLVQHIPDIFSVIDTNGNIIDVNRHACEKLGYTRDELLGLNVQNIEQNFTAAKHAEQWKRIVPGVPILVEGVQIRKDGTTFPAEIRIGMFESVGKKFFLTLTRDITERKQAEEALRESEKRYRQIVDNADDIIYGVDNRGHFTLINPVAARITRYSEHELIGKHYLDLVSPAYRKDTQRFYRLQFVRRRQNTYYEFPIVAKDGTEVWLGQNVQLVIEGGRVVGFQAVARDITNRKRAEDTIRELAYQDALTGLPNRVLFNDRFSMALAQARRHQQRLGIMLLDLDHFKDINDSLGHSVGDKLLRVVGERLAGLLRTSDTIARMGGDEFLLLLTEIARLNDVITIAQKILGVLRKPFAIDDHEFMITTSIGITIFPDDGDTADILLKNADIAMYRAKERGRDNFQCYSSTPS